MNGLPLPQLPAGQGFPPIEELDPLNLLNSQHKQQIDSLQSSFNQQQQLIRRNTDNQLQMLNRGYDIEYKALREHFDRVEATEENMRRFVDTITNLNTKYALRADKAQGKIDPDLQDLESRKQQDLQKLNMQYHDKMTAYKVFEKLRDDGKLDPDEFLQQTLELAGVNVPISYLKPPTLGELTKEMLAVSFAAKRGDKEAIKRLETLKGRRETLLAQLPPGEADAIRKSTQLSTSGIKGRKPGTFAESVAQAKPTMRWPLQRERPIETVPTAEELRKQGTKEAYERGRQLGYWN